MFRKFMRAWFFLALAVAFAAVAASNGSWNEAWIIVGAGVAGAVIVVALTVRYDHMRVVPANNDDEPSA